MVDMCVRRKDRTYFAHKADALFYFVIELEGKNSQLFVRDYAIGVCANFDE